MKRCLTFCAGILFLPAAGIAAERSVPLQDLPPLIQKSVQGLIKGADLKGITQEVSNGKTAYEIETIKNGRTRDLLIDGAGSVLEIEEGTALDRVPAPVKAAIEKAAAGGKVLKVEAVTKGGITSYEAVIAEAGKHREIQVTAGGLIKK